MVAFNKNGQEIAGEDQCYTSTDHLFYIHDIVVIDAVRLVT